LAVFDPGARGSGDHFAGFEVLRRIDLRAVRCWKAVDAGISTGEKTAECKGRLRDGRRRRIIIEGCRNVAVAYDVEIILYW
jgi:hypothetical protein